MKIKVLVGLAMASLFVVGAWADGNDLDTPPGETKDTAKSRPSRESRRGGMFAMGIVDQITKACTDLTEDQKTKLKAAGEELNKVKQEWMKANEEKLKDVMNKMREAYQGQDQTAIAAAKAEMEKLRAEQLKAEADARKNVVAILTAEQKQVWQQFVVMQSIQMMSRRIKLTDEQMTKVKEMVKTAVANVDFTDTKVEADTVKTVMEKIKSDVLTEEQKKSMESRGNVPPLGEGGPGGGRGGEGGGPGGGHGGGRGGE